MRLIFLVATSLFFAIRADQPVTCGKSSKSYVGGTWTFYATPEPQTLNLYEQDEVCTHRLPNSVQIIAQGYEFSMEQFDTWKVRITDDQNV